MSNDIDEVVHTTVVDGDESNALTTTGASATTAVARQHQQQPSSVIASSSTATTTANSDTTNFDYHIMKTADDALKAKYAAVQAKYYSDPYISTFYHHSNPHTKNNHSSSSAAAAAAAPPVQVIIKRGTYARVVCIYKTISTFFDLSCQLQQPSSSSSSSGTAINNSKVQIIVLGSGKDTTFFRIMKERYLQSATTLKQEQQQSPGLHWFEVDHEGIVQQKINMIQNNASTFDHALVHHRTVNTSAVTTNNVVYEIVPTQLHRSNQVQCHFIGHNLNHHTDQLMNTLLDYGMDPTIPTLIVCECVLMYMKTDVATTLLQTFYTTCEDCIIVSYEPILGIKSIFGRVMEDNLHKVGIVQPSSCLLELRTIQQYIQKLYSTIGYMYSIGCDMYTAYETIVSQEQRAHANKCEFLDELEEFILIMQHYCFIVSCNNGSSVIGKRMCTIELKDDSDSCNPIGFVPGRCEHL